MELTLPGLKSQTQIIAHPFFAAQRSGSFQSGIGYRVWVGRGADWRAEPLLEPAKQLKNGKRQTICVSGELIGTHGRATE